MEMEKLKMSASEIRKQMAVFFNGKNGIQCGYGLDHFRLDHVESDWKKAEMWCEQENIRLRDQMVEMAS